MRPFAPQSSLLLLALALALAPASARADDFDARCADRAALERIYHEHRLGQKPPFEKALPSDQIERLVRRDRQKEAVLRRVYGVEITPAQLAAEMERITATTRAADMLAQLRQALGNDSARVAETLARPLLVERELRRRFETDDALHADQRRKSEAARARLLAGDSADGLNEVTWQLAPRPETDGATAAAAHALTSPTLPTAPISANGASATYTVEATAQLSQVVASPAADSETERDAAYFADLDPQLQNVLRAQLRKPGDVSAVIETPTGFLVFIARESTPQTLAAGALFLPKLGYDAWVAEQAGETS